MHFQEGAGASSRSGERLFELNLGGEAVTITPDRQNDKTFPKDSSLRAGGRQELLRIGEFGGKLAAAKAAGNVLVIARTEALIAGLGQDEALRRGEAYAEAGADGVLIPHPKTGTGRDLIQPT
jgi:2-methylisocitrate lyase-like PEP mutase family enzyme